MSIFLSMFITTFIPIIYNMDSMSIFLSMFINTFISIIYNIDSITIFLSMLHSISTLVI